MINKQKITENLYPVIIPFVFIMIFVNTNPRKDDNDENINL